MSTEATAAVGPILAVDGLTVEIQDRRGRSTRIIDDVTFSISPGEIVGVIGESGSGKTMTAMAVLGLLPPAARIVAGDVRLDGRSMVGLTEGELRQLRGSRIALVPQDALSSLNPTISVDKQVGEPLVIHERAGWGRARSRALELLKLVHLPQAERRASALPHQLSGGMTQRAMIAMALALNRPLIIADEPTTALDVTIQAQILRLLRDIRDRSGVGVMLITHDLGVVAEVADAVVVMYAGRVVERGGAQRVLSEPSHPYTRALLGATPRIEADRVELVPIPGQMPSPDALPTGCRFADRCPARIDRCDEEPPLIEHLPGQHARCWLA